MRRTQSLDDAYPKLGDAEAKKRLLAYASRQGQGPHTAAALAGVIWPDRDWRSAQGAGAAASRVLKRLGFRWHCETHRGGRQSWGWLLL